MQYQWAGAWLSAQTSESRDRSIVSPGRKCRRFSIFTRLIMVSCASSICRFLLLILSRCSCNVVFSQLSANSPLKGHTNTRLIFESISSSSAVFTVVMVGFSSSSGVDRHMGGYNVLEPVSVARAIFSSLVASSGVEWRALSATM